MGQIRDLQTQIHEMAKTKGWWDKLDDYKERGEEAVLMTAKIGLIACEAAEAIEEIRDDRIATWYNEEPGKEGKPEGAGMELADVVIRAMDTCGAMDLDLEALILEKIEYNMGRPWRHGGKKV